MLLPEHVDVLLRGVDLLHRIAQAPDDKIETEKSERADEVQQFLRDLAKVRVDDRSEAAKEIVRTAAIKGHKCFRFVVSNSKTEAAITTPSKDVDDAKRKHQRFLRVTPENLNRLLALTGESLVESRRLGSFFRVIAASQAAA